MSYAKDYWNALNEGRYVNGLGDLSWDQLGASGQQAVENYYNNVLLPSKLNTPYSYGAYIGPHDDYTMTPKTWQDDWYTAHNLGAISDPTKLDGYTGSNILPQASLLYAIAPQIAESLGITKDEALSLARQNDSFNTTAAADDASASNKQGWIMALSTIGSGVGGAYAGLGDSVAGANAYSAGMGGGADIGAAEAGAMGAGESAAASSAADDAALDQIVNDSMAQPWTASDQVAVNSAGGTPFTDPTTGLTYDAGGLGQGTSSGGTSWLDTLKSWASKGSTAKSLAGMLSGGGGASGGGVPSIYDPSSPISSGVTGGSSGGASVANTVLENPMSSYQSLSTPAQQQSNQFGLVDVSPASNAFNMAGATWNSKMANALRGK